MRRLVPIMALLLLLGGMEVMAQQEARYTQYMFNKLVLNPAYAGSTEALSLTGVFRKQWVSIDGAPQSASFSAHAPIGQKIGLGGFIEYDQIGVHKGGTLNLSYAYKFIINESRLAVGVQGGLRYLKSNWTELEGNSFIDPSLEPTLFANNESRIMPNFGVGLYFYNPNKFYVGASIPHLINNDLGVTKIAHQYRHYYFMAGGVIPAGSALKVKPSVLLKVVPKNAPMQLDANLMFLIKNTLWLGSSFRFDQGFSPESIDFIAAVQLNNGLKVGYAYDYTLSKLNEFTSGSHEIMVGYDFKQEGIRIRTPRYF